MRLERAMWVAWPSFLMASVLEMLVFAVLDPADLHWLGQPVEMSRQGVYTLSFFAFWLVIGIACAMTGMLARPPEE